MSSSKIGFEMDFKIGFGLRGDSSLTRLHFRDKFIAGGGQTDLILNELLIFPLDNILAHILS